jgi:hypothetical protein
VSTAHHWARASAGIVGACALMCAGPALVMGRESQDTGVAAASAAAGATGQVLGAPSLSRGDRAAKGDKPAKGGKANGDKVDDSDRHDRRPFTQPPGQRGTPARDAAPGRVRSQAPPPAAEEPPAAPRGAVLGATPKSVDGPPGPARGRLPRSSESASRGVLTGIGRDDQPPLSAAITNGARSAVALGGVLGITAAYNPAYGELGLPATQNALAAALLLMVLGAQAIAGALLLSATRDMLGGVGPPQ